MLKTRLRGLFTNPLKHIWQDYSHIIDDGHQRFNYESLCLNICSGVSFSSILSANELLDFWVFRGFLKRKWWTELEDIFCSKDFFNFKEAAWTKNRTCDCSNMLFVFLLLSIVAILHCRSSFFRVLHNVHRKAFNKQDVGSMSWKMRRQAKTPNFANVDKLGRMVGVQTEVKIRSPNRHYQSYWQGKIYHLKLVFSFSTLNWQFR